MNKLILTGLFFIGFTLNAGAQQAAHYNHHNQGSYEPATQRPYEPARMPFCGKLVFSNTSNATVSYTTVCGVTFAHCENSLTSAFYNTTVPQNTYVSTLPCRPN